MPLNFTAGPASPLNVPYITSSLTEWPDARMISYLTHGVRFEVDLVLQLVLFPHLISFPNGFAFLQKEVRRMQSRSWFDIFCHLLYLPIQMICDGATPHKFEPNRWRSTTDGGAPRKRLTDESRFLVPCINDLLGQLPHPFEQKPTPRDLANDLALLSHAAHLASGDVFIVTDDVADYFPHLNLAPTEYWFSILATLLLSGDKDFAHGDKLAFVAECVLEFGLLCPSKYAHLLSIILLVLLHDARTHTALMYTDDVVLAAVGTERIVALLRAWNKVTRAVGLTMAISEKRQAGSSILWLGVVFVAAASVLFLPRDKAVRAVERIQRTLPYSMDTAALRKLCGLLEHVRESG
eukprot:6204567-Pleurochrysis_carterae.AAC.3